MEAPISDPALTFVIPVRHPATVPDWAVVRDRLAETLRSIAAQTSPSWRCVIAANAGTDLPPLPEKTSVAWVDRPPAELPKPPAKRDLLYQAIRRDKGARIVAGLAHALPRGHVMVVDYDDLVSKRLAAVAERAPAAQGWFFAEGYVFGEGAIVLRREDFNHYCGTSHIIRADLLGGPGEWMDEAYVMRRLGSHIFIQRDLEAEGAALTPLPFPGAMYRVGHGSSIGSGAVLAEAFPRRMVRREPARALRRLARLRYFGPRLRAEFCG